MARAVTPGRADLIRLVAGGGWLDGWLPGADHGHAAAQLVTGMHSWSAYGGRGEACKAGIRHVPYDGSPPALITWAKVAEVVAAGCGGGRLETYRAARAAVREYNRHAEAEFQRWQREWRPGTPAGGTDLDWYGRVHSAESAAARAIIDAGCAPPPVLVPTGLPAGTVFEQVTLW